MSELNGKDPADLDNPSRSDTPVPSKTTNLFQTALQTWTEIDLSSLQKKLDDQGIELKDAQKDSLLSRKKLASRTKDFKKLDDESKLQEFKSLLKLYQNEIDSLTEKLKKVESYFFGFYRLLAEAPDPRPLLEISLDSVIDSAESSSLKKEMNRLQEELSKKADYDQIKQRLVRNEQKSAELLSTKLQAKEEEMKAVIEEKESNWKVKESGFEKQLNDYKNKMEELRSSKEVTELQLNSQNQQIGSREGTSAAILAELDIVRRDSETSKKRIFELEKRNESLRSELSKSQSKVDQNNMKEEMTKKISELEGENALLAANLNQVRKSLETNSSENETKVESFQREVSHLNVEIKNLKTRIDQTSDYDEIRHELQLLRQIEFGIDDEDEGKSEERSKHVDSLLVERNKALTKELADYRSQHDDLNNRITSLEQQLNTASQELERHQQLNSKLENDLADMQEGGKFNDNVSLISGVSRMTRGFGDRASIVSGGDEGSILPIITKQRDRFREKNNELEEDLRKQYAIVNDLKRQMKSLKKDNEELYERTRYLASFKPNDAQLFAPVATQSFGARTSNRKLLKPHNSGTDIDLESNSAYQESYESKLHPIEQFRIREQERISSRLSPLERLFISITRAILATRYTRMIFLGYCIGLHCIVMFMTIYTMGMNTRLVPEVGLNTSTGGVADGMAGSPDHALPGTVP